MSMYAKPSKQAAATCLHSKECSTISRLMTCWRSFTRCDCLVPVASPCTLREPVAGFESGKNSHCLPCKCKYFSLNNLWKIRVDAQNQQLTNWLHNCCDTGAVWRSSLFQESQRAIDIMRCQLPEQRREARIHNQASGTVFTVDQPAQAQPAQLRDLNTLGAFFYSKLKASAGQSIALHIMMPKSGDGKQLKISCQGTVLRVEPGYDSIGAGFALQFSQYDISWVH
jgi:hypothetical protein